MNIRNKKHVVNEPLIIHLRDGEDEQDDEKVDVIRLQEGHVATARPADSPTARGRGLRDQPAVADNEEIQPPSKTKIKKQMHQLRDLGKELAKLSNDQVMQLDIPESLRDAIIEAGKINKFGAQRRQIQYIGKLMREVDPAPIIAKLDSWQGKSQRYTAYMHLLERWRDRLMDDDNVLTELLADHPEADAQRLRALIRNAQNEIKNGKQPKSYREIFRLLREIIPEPT
jgi:ribosome-associated protein